MTSAQSNLATQSIDTLIDACAREASRKTPHPDHDSPCYELFRRACTPPHSEAAWRAILNQYRRLVYHWLGQHASEDHVQEVFLRFWQAQVRAERAFSARFPHIGAVLRYLKQCAITVRIAAWRDEKRRRALQEHLQTEARRPASAPNPVKPTSTPLYQLLVSKLKTEEEHVVFKLSYVYDLPPREIQALHPELFPTVRKIYRVKENLLKRLRRDPEVQAWLP